MATVRKTKRFSVFDVAVGNGSGTKDDVAAGNGNEGFIRTEGNESFTRTIKKDDEEVMIDFVIVKLDQSCFAWCGVRTDHPKLQTLALGMVLNKTKPASTSIVGSALMNAAEDEASAIRIAKKANLVAVHFSSYLGNDADHTFRLFAEKTIVDALKG